MKNLLGFLFFLMCNSLVSSAQTFTGGGGSIITLTDTSRFNLNVSGLSPSIMNFNFGLESVTISINHTRDADIDCFLAAPDGTRIELTTDNGGTSDNYVNTVFRHDAATSITSGSAPFTGTYRPEGDLWRVNNGQNGNGTWQLRVIDDNNNGVTGTLVSWKLTFGNTPAKTFIFDQSNLPIVVINTNGQNIVDDPKIICDMGIIYNGPGVRNHLSDPFNNYSGKIAIEVRGSSSQQFPKKSYGFETRGPNTQVDSNVSLLGMPLEHDWILSANYTDKSFCRNVLAYRLSNEMGHYAVRTRFVDVVINGVYKGIYVLMESVKRDKSRVDIKKLYTNETTYPDISGGYIIKIDKTTGGGGAGWNSPYLPVNHSNNQKIYFQYDYPKPDSIVISQKAYIQAYVDSFESRLSGSNFMDSTLGYAKYIGNGSFIDYFFSNEISKNVDGYRISSYLYKDKEKTLKAGPVWDYDIAWGNANYCNGNTTSGWSYQFSCTGDNYQPPFWWQRMLQDSNYANQMKCRWIEYRSGILSTAHIHGIIDSIALVLNESKDWNFTAWPILGTYVWPNPSPYPSTYAGEITNLKNWISARLSYMDSNLPGNCNCSFAIAKQNVSCLNACDGQAVALGVSPYKKTYLWDTGAGTDTLKNLCPGTYSVDFEDAIGCKRTATTSITQPALLTASATAQNATCAGGSCNGTSTITVNGGTAPYSYAWSGGQTTATVNTLCPGSHTVTITDARGCICSVTVNISNPGAPAVTVVSQSAVTCPGGNSGTAVVNVSGGVGPYSYQWSPFGGTSNSASGLSAGIYTLTATDQNGCQGSRSITISQPPSFSSVTNSVSPLCFASSSGTASIQLSGGTAPYSYAWSPSGVTLANASSLPAGNYTINVTDAAGCTHSRGIVITQPSALSNTSTVTHASCFGSSDGSAQVFVSGGVAPYSYQWTQGAGTSSAATSLAAGNYSLTITDANSCTHTNTVTVNQPSLILLNTSSSPAMCGGSDGTASVLASGGTGAYQYMWLPTGGTSALAQNLSAGTYTIRVTDINSCSQSAQVHVINSNGLNSVVSNKNDVSCNGGSNGSATIIASNGNPPYTYSWSPSGGTASGATGLSAGIYTVTIQDALGCINIQQVNILEPPAINFSVSTSAVSCFGGNDGSATSVVNGGTSPYSYQWLPSGGTSVSAQNLSAGNYSLRVTDSNACTLTQSFVLDQPSQIQISATSTDASCSLNNGEITLGLNGGVSPYSILWPVSGDTTLTLSDLFSGSYAVQITDSLNCMRAASFSIGDTPGPGLEISSQVKVTCNGGSDGAVSLNTLSGTSPFNYTWSPVVSTSSSASGLFSGIYTVNVIDSIGCRDSITLLIEEPAPLAMILFVNDVTCAGAMNGEIFAEVGGGTLPYVYEWNPGGQSSDTAKNLGPGVYSVLVTDSNLCTATSSASITEPTALAATVISTDETCGGLCDGTAFAQLSGGTMPYRFLWCDGDTAAAAVNLCEGMCSLTITDGNNCLLVDSFVIDGPDPLDLTVIHNDVTCTGCSDGSAIVTVSGGAIPYSFLWTGTGQSTASVSGLTAGVYEICVTDSQLCEKCELVEILDASLGIEEEVSLAAFYVYPNPLSERTTFLFSLKSKQFVRLQIFDLSGKLLRTIIESDLVAGEHVRAFDASDLSSGIYFFRFSSNERSQAGRLIISR
ncbi:MAG: T9SS type A sorting domain-containing protein [Bacteroidetes bacterium]|nr:MAG: T9SS type A sorting domain-containing protein [Bacteroidota bacterium]